MFDHLIRSNELWGDFERYHLTETDVTFVKEMIAGPLPENKGKVSSFNMCGRRAYVCCARTFLLFSDFKLSKSSLLYVDRKLC